MLISHFIGLPHLIKNNNSILESCVIYFINKAWRIFIVNISINNVYLNKIKINK